MIKYVRLYVSTILIILDFIWLYIFSRPDISWTIIVIGSYSFAIILAIALLLIDKQITIYKQTKLASK